jgi:hypothetical protein
MVLRTKVALLLIESRSSHWSAASKGERSQQRQAIPNVSPPSPLQMALYWVTVDPVTVQDQGETSSEEL